MSKVKRSFLEKLTGARRSESEDDDNTDNLYETERKAPAASLYREDRPMETPANPAFRQSPRGENFSAPDDNEGQLTIDVYQTDNDVVVKSTIAGVKPEDLEVNINNDMLTIRGERKQEEVVQEENYYYQECYWGSFSRSVILPVNVLADKIEASMKNGILTVRMPKADSNRTKKIQVRGF